MRLDAIKRDRRARYTTRNTHTARSSGSIGTTDSKGPAGAPYATGSPLATRGNAGPGPQNLPTMGAPRCGLTAAANAADLVLAHYSPQAVLAAAAPHSAWEPSPSSGTYAQPQAATASQPSAGRAMPIGAGPPAPSKVLMVPCVAVVGTIA